MQKRGQSSFSIISHFLPNPGRILSGLTLTGCNPLAGNDELQEKFNVKVTDYKPRTAIPSIMVLIKFRKVDEKDLRLPKYY